MTLTCQRVAEQATERLEGGLSEEARRAFDAHAQGCDGCTAFVRQLQVTTRVLRRLEPPEVPAHLASQLLQAFDARLAAAKAPEPTPWWVGAAPVAATVAVLAGLSTLARAKSPSASDLVVAGGLALAALIVAASARGFGAVSAGAATVAALLAALAAGGGGALEASEGVVCVALESLGAGTVALASWAAARRTRGELARRQAAGGAVAGALAADAVLQVACGAHLALAHVAVFHVGAVAAVALLGARLASRKSAKALV